MHAKSWPRAIEVPVSAQVQTSGRYGTIELARSSGARFRNDVEVGPGGKQIQIEDPDGNPIEIHEPPK
jgi:hypothetical protein